MLTNDKPYRREVSALAGGFSTPVPIPGWLKNIVATAIPGAGGTATVFHTTDEIDDVEADPANANWVAWDAGSVAAITSQAALGQITAIRLQAVTENAVLQVAGSRRS